MLFCDLNSCSDNQLAHVHKIVFIDPFSSKNWHDYIVYAIGKFSSKKRYMIKLLLFALDTLAGIANSDESAYIRLNMLKAAFAR